MFLLQIKITRMNEAEMRWKMKRGKKNELKNKQTNKKRANVEQNVCSFPRVSVKFRHLHTHSPERIV